MAAPIASGDWVEANFPKSKSCDPPRAPRFELARARNLGAARVRSPWICFIDADTRVDADFCERLKPLLGAGASTSAESRNRNLGHGLCAKADFERIGGYDEVIQGWGKEDEDFYARLLIAGVRYGTLPRQTCSTAISHADGERVAHYDVKDRWLSESINHVYCRAKIDLMLLQHTPLALDVRKELYAQVHAAVMTARESGKPVTLAVPLSDARRPAPAAR